MTSDRSAKKAARARMAGTGEPYSTARRAVQTRPDRPAPLARPPAIDPREHAVHSHRWGVLTCYLVHYEGRYSAWITSADPGEPSDAYGMRSEPAGRAFVDTWQATNLLHTPWDERIATTFLLSPDTSNGILYEAAVVNAEDSGIWVACFDDTANDGGTHTLSQPGGMDEALEEFAALAERAADRLASRQAIGKAALFAGVLRYRAATVRADAARAALGDAIRRHQPRADGGDGLHALWHEAGLARESVGRVLAGEEWTWPQRPVVRPPGSRLPDTPTTTLATRTVDGHRFDLVSYLDKAGGRCIAIDRDGRPDASACDIQVDEQRLASAAMTMATRGHGTAAIYGRVHDSVTELYAVMKNGERVDWPIYDDPRNQERYFAVIADPEALADIVAAAPTRSTSLKQSFGIWFSPPPGPGPRRPRARGH
ncbi:MAG TPA: hypothetical protein VGS06_14505 [Streptosporangiaceae bacterium]|nr:hypothetical protein [Streptosporangiaceae bacterium]